MPLHDNGDQAKLGTMALRCLQTLLISLDHPSSVCP